MTKTIQADGYTILDTLPVNEESVRRTNMAIKFHQCAIDIAAPPAHEAKYKAERDQWISDLAKKTSQTKEEVQNMLSDYYRRFANLVHEEYDNAKIK